MAKNRTHVKPATQREKIVDYHSMPQTVEADEADGWHTWAWDTLKKTGEYRLHQTFLPQNTNANHPE